MLSDRCSLDKWPIEHNVTSAHYVESYIKCIHFMYSSQAGKRFCFSTVDEALAILPIASELLFHDGVDGCMSYLDAVHWSPEQESRLRASLTSLQINVLPALATRLAGTGHCNSDCGHLEMLEETLQEMLSMISSESTNSTLHCTVEKYIEDNIKADSTSDIADTCRAALLKEFCAHVQAIKSKMGIKYRHGTQWVDNTEYIDDISWLLRLVDLIQRCDGELFETVLKVFCEDGDLPTPVTKVIRSKEAMVDILDLLVNRFLKPVGNGEIITPASFRVSFLETWVATMSTLIFKINSKSKNPLGKDKFQEPLERGIIGVAETLPLIQQRRIYKIWIDAFKSNSMDISRAFEWWTKKLQGAHGEPK